MKRVLKLLVTILIILAVLLVVVFGLYKIKSMQSGSFNVVIIGIDAREGDEIARSDSIMIANIDSSHETITLTSIPRDSYVYIPVMDAEDKINHSYANGGRDGLIETLEDVFETDLPYYVEVDFFKMIELVDAIGGIDMVPTATFCEMDENDNKQKYCFSEGEKLHMNGAQALSYARHRKSDTDFNRSLRQQEVIQAMVSKVKNNGVISMLGFYKDVTKISDTNVNLWSLLGYADMAFKDFDLEHEVADGEGAMLYSPLYNQELYFYLLDEGWIQEKIELYK